MYIELLSPRAQQADEKRRDAQRDKDIINPVKHPNRNDQKGLNTEVSAAEFAVKDVEKAASGKEGHVHS